MTIQENRGVCNSFAYRGKYLRKRALIIYIIILNQKLQDEGEKKAKGIEKSIPFCVSMGICESWKINPGDNEWLPRNTHHDCGIAALLMEGTCSC